MQHRKPQKAGLNRPQNALLLRVQRERHAVLHVPLQQRHAVRALEVPAHPQHLHVAARAADEQDQPVAQEGEGGRVLVGVWVGRWAG